MVRKALKYFSDFLIILLVSVCLLELVYRFYLFDFYRTEFRALNKNLKGDPKKKTVLVFGDSFSAQELDYTDWMRDSLDINLYNFSVPGTCIKQQRLYANEKIAALAPDAVIFQVYVGNDLLDIAHPINWRAVSFMRNLYWMTSEKIQSLAFLNYRFGQVRALSGDEIKVTTTKEQAFHVERYSPRTKLFLSADEKYLEESIHLTGDRKDDFEELLKYYTGVLEEMDETVKVYFLIVPHCVQVGSEYYANYLALGMKGSEPETFTNLDYPFLQGFKNKFKKATIISPLGLFSKANKKENIYYNNDPHLNAEGQELLFQAVKDKLFIHE